MPRLPRAATTLFMNLLIYTAENGLPNPMLTHASEPDGLDVIRTIRFDKVTAKWLGPLLTEIADPRITEVTSKRDGLHVTFHAGTKADTRDPYPLVDAALVVGLRHPTVPKARKVPKFHDPLTPDEAS